ncbi:olfactory receptor 5I1-like [Pleurodeles waltl]|uniref:olfactory receptor 5I1-like n=1 Tax=Pleurodeles waltl TaxID=8319 RepID=UPI003709AC00
MTNYSSVREFVLRGFSDVPDLQIIYFVMFLSVYLVAVLANLVIFIVTSTNRHLQTPMYFFIGNLSFLDMLYISITIPKMLADFFSARKTISFLGCVAQLYFFLTMAATESALLASMAYDRYVAICIPLRYPTIMSRGTCIQLAAASWMLGVVYSTLHTTNTFQLDFCSSHVIDHYFCDIPALLKLSCTDTHSTELMVFVVGSLHMLGCFLFIIASYFHVVRSVMKMSSTKGRKKTFSTCAPHLVAVALFYFTGSFVYFKPSSRQSPEQGKVGSIFYCIIAPMLNPFIYSLRNNELKSAIRKAVRKRGIWW